MGTVGYMSPEQVQGLSADQRSDIFSFGAVIFEMFWGRRAFKGATAVETMNAILKEDPPEVSDADRPVPPALERIARRCLEKKPQERFHSAHDLALALEALSGASVAPAVVAPSRRRGTSWGRLAWTLVAATLLGGLVAGLLLGRRAATEQQPLIKLNLAFSPDEAPVLTDSPVLALYLARNAWDRLTSGGINWSPVWSNDGERLAFCSNREDRMNTFSMPIDRSAPAERMATTSTWTCPPRGRRTGGR